MNSFVVSSIPAKENQSMNRQKAVDVINSGRFFSVEFRKRSDGTVRKMSGRAGVKKHRKGGKPAYNPDAKGLTWVWDMVRHGYRSIPNANILRIKIKGEWRTVKENT